MLASLLNVRTFLLAIFLIMAGSGFLSTLIAVRLEAAGASALVIGLAATAYFTGLFAGSLTVSKLIGNVGHIRSFAAFVSVFSASSLAYALHESAAIWLVLRFIDGLVIAGIYICLESWLNEKAEPANRSSVLAGYMVALYSGQAVGQFLLNLGEESPALPFMYSAILLSIAVLPVVLTKDVQPKIEDLKPLAIKKLYRISPLGVVGVTATGLMLGAFYALGAVFIRRLGMDLSDVAFFTSCVIAGGVALQWPLGMLSDRFDRRRVIVGTFVGAVLVCAAIMYSLDSRLLLFPLGALFGGMTFALYPLCVAHTNDHIDESQRVGATGGLVLAYSAGAMVGPVVGSIGMGSFGAGGLFGAIGVVALSVSAFGFWRLFIAQAVPAEDQQAFQNLPRTTPMATSQELDPDERASSD